MPATPGCSTRCRARPTGPRSPGSTADGQNAPGSVTGQPVFAQCDPNLANHLWDGNSVHLVDFETSGRGDRATELADFAEHITVWAHAGISAEAFLDRFDLNPGERQQITQLRRLFALSGS